MLIDIIYDMSLAHIGLLEIDFWPSISSKMTYRSQGDKLFLILFWQTNLAVALQDLYGSVLERPSASHESWSMARGSWKMRSMKKSSMTVREPIRSEFTKNLCGILLESLPFNPIFIVFHLFFVRRHWTICLILTVLIFIKMQTWIPLMICNVLVPVNHLAHIRIGSPDTDRSDQHHRSGLWGEPW